jgi:hypothetical protein
MLDVKNGIMKGRFPIIMCKNLREVFRDTPKILSILPETKITSNM